MNNLNDGMVWGLFPLLFAAANLSLDRIGARAAIYPATWSIGQLVTGALSDRIGRKWLIAGGMWVQAIGIAAVIVSNGFAGFAMGGVLLGIGTAMVYPTLLAAIGDVAAPAWRDVGRRGHHFSVGRDRWCQNGRNAAASNGVNAERARMQWRVRVQ